MKKIEYGKWLCLSLGALTISCTSQPSKKPNVVYILADDLGYGDLSCYNPEGKIETPILDQLAEEGVRFTNAHSSAAVSSPTRYGILTGRYPWRSRMKMGVLWTWAHPLIEEEYTLPQMFQDQGYHTGLVGKWHLGIEYPTSDCQPMSAKNNGANVDYTALIPDGPINHGFDYYYGDDVPNFPPYVFIENDRFTAIPDMDFPENYPGVPGALSSQWHAEDLLSVESSKAAEYIDQHKKEPFFLMVTLTAPHTPIAPSDSFKGKSQAGRYGDFVQEMDHHIGIILDALVKAGVDDDTIVIFSSDNGSSFQDGGSDNGEKYAGSFGSILKHGHCPSGPYRGMKADAYEGGHRIPMIVRWPEKLAVNQTDDRLVCDIDWFATLADIISAELPEGAAWDSRSFKNVFSIGQEHRQDLVVQSGNGVLSLIQDGYKLITSSGTGGNLNPVDKTGEISKYEEGSWKNIQLYHLDTDLDERNNLAEKEPERVETMLSSLAAIVLERQSPYLWKQVKWIEQINNN